MFQLPPKNAALALTIIFAVLTVVVVTANLPSICTTTFLGCALLYGVVWFFKFDRDRQLRAAGRREAARMTPPRKHDELPARMSRGSERLFLPSRLDSDRES